MKQLDHEKLEVYAAAIDFVALADDVVENLPRGRAYLADQLQRGATSVALNIAEGAGEFAAGDKARFYRMARRSATESAAILHVCERLTLIDHERSRTGRDLLVSIVSMLVTMIRRDGRSDEGAATDAAPGMGKGKGRGRGV
jgi:four helix bundle protein